jgi:hypothetical protein
MHSFALSVSPFPPFLPRISLFALLPVTNSLCFFLLFFGFGFLWAVLIINHRLSHLEKHHLLCKRGLLDAHSFVFAELQSRQQAGQHTSLTPRLHQKKAAVTRHNTEMTPSASEELGFVGFPASFLLAGLLPPLLVAPFAALALVSTAAAATAATAASTAVLVVVGVAAVEREGRFGAAFDEQMVEGSRKQRAELLRRQRAAAKAELEKAGRVGHLVNFIKIKSHKYTQKKEAQ